MQTMRGIVAASLPHTEATIAFDEGYPPMAPTEQREAARDTTKPAAIRLGAVTAVSPDRAGAADVSFVASEVRNITTASA